MIKENVKKILDELPENVKLVAAAKTRTPEEIKEVIEAGVKIVGENYVQEARRAFEVIGKEVKWHFIGTVDSYPLAHEINERCKQIDKIMPILIEINSGREKQKFGIFPEDALDLVQEISLLPQIKIMGLMTMGPRFGDPEDSRPYFIETRKIFKKIKAFNLPRVEMEYLSMGMTNSYQIAIEEKANMVRIGALIFGKRNYKN